MTVSEAKRQTRLAEWGSNVREQQNSGLSIKEWCGRSGVRESKYYYWLKLVREEAIKRARGNCPEGALVRIEPDKMPVSQGAMPRAPINTHEGIVVRYGGATVEFPAESDVAEIAALLRALTVV